MLSCHSYYIYGTWRSKNVGGLKSSYGGNGGKWQRGYVYGGPHPIKNSLVGYPGELTPQLVCLNYLPIPTSFGVKRVIIHCKTFLLIKTSYKLGSLGKIKF